MLGPRCQREYFQGLVGLRNADYAAGDCTNTTLQPTISEPQKSTELLARNLVNLKGIHDKMSVLAIEFR